MQDSYQERQEYVLLILQDRDCFQEENWQKWMKTNKNRRHRWLDQVTFYATAVRDTTQDIIVTAPAEL